MKHITTLFAVLMLSQAVWAQKDSTDLIRYTPDFRFNDGIYLKFEDVKKNKPIPKERIVTNADPKKFDFFEKVLIGENISLYDMVGELQSIPIDDIWGFAQNGILYIQMHNEFNRIPIIGSISHFVANETLIHESMNPNSYNAYNGYNYSRYRTNRYNSSPTSTYTTKEMKQYVLDFETGDVREYSREAVTVSLMRDPELHDEFSNLSSRKQEKKKFYYIRKFNERNPLYLPVN